MQYIRRQIEGLKDWLSYHTPTERHLSGSMGYYWKLLGPLAFVIATIFVASRI